MKIVSEQHYIEIMQEVEVLYRKGFSNLSEEEERTLDKLSKLAEKWESEHQTDNSN